MQTSSAKSAQSADHLFRLFPFRRCAAHGWHLGRQCFRCLIPNRPQVRLNEETLAQMRATIWSGIHRPAQTPPPTSMMALDVPLATGLEDGGGTNFPPPGDAHNRCSTTGVDANLFSPGGGNSTNLR
ncbi:MAG TPA: hypothetical protein VEH27_18115 [Methylomirabilota bacterium]|nr:hypothetical protein [Methylomirabilota bacterium]